ncbi:MAG: mechanosensitive ion channel domain-containing protein, partial [Pseudomonadota bacterium]
VELVGRATILSALGLVALLFGQRLLGLSVQAPRIPLPRTLETILPNLGQRLSGFVAPVFVVSGIVLIGLAGVFLLEGWRLIDVAKWLADGGTAFLWRVASLVIVAAVLLLAWSVLSSWIDRHLASNLPQGERVSARSRTLLALFRNALSIALFVFAGMTILSEFGVDIAPLIAGAGVIGLAIGFGAQKLVQDIITGVFIQLENAINEGDVVTVAGVTGGVEKLTIRSVGIRDLSGVYHLIPFSAVDTVSNYMRLFAYHVEVVGVAYETDLEDARKAMHDAFDAVKAGPLGSEIIAPLDYHGVVGLADSAVNLRARIKTRPGQQWAVGRAYTAQLKKAFDAAGVEIPFPHRELKLPKAVLRRLIGPDERSRVGS